MKCSGLSCVATADVQKTGFIGALEEATGFRWIPLAGGTSLWLCPSCAERVHDAYRQIVELVGEEPARCITLVSLRRF